MLLQNITVYVYRALNLVTKACRTEERKRKTKVLSPLESYMNSGNGASWTVSCFHSPHPTTQLHGMLDRALLGALVKNLGTWIPEQCG